MKTSQSVSILLLLFAASSDATRAATLTLRQFDEQSSWIGPRQYGGYLNFEALLSERPADVQFEVRLESDYAAIEEFGRVRIDIRTDGFRAMRELNPLLRLETASEQRSGTLRVPLPGVPFDVSAVAKGTNLVALLTERVPKLTGCNGTLRVTLSMCAVWGSEETTSTIERVFDVRGLYPRVLMSTAKTAHADFTLYVRGGLPFQRYELEESSDLLTWKWSYAYSSFTGDSSVGMRYTETKRFFLVVPSSE